MPTVIHYGTSDAYLWILEQEGQQIVLRACYSSHAFGKDHLWEHVAHRDILPPRTRVLPVNSSGRRG